jgi:hypothetical protein
MILFFLSSCLPYYSKGARVPISTATGLPQHFFTAFADSNNQG